MVNNKLCVDSHTALNFCLLLETLCVVWNAKRFDGSKALVYSEVGFMGIKNSFAGIAFLSIGSTCGFFAIIVGVFRPRCVSYPLLLVGLICCIDG